MQKKFNKIFAFGGQTIKKLKDLFHSEDALNSNDSKKVYGIICAMEEETQPIVARMEKTRVRQISVMTFYVGYLFGQKVIVVKCGIGKVNAAICAEILCLRFRVDALINVGVAGSPFPGIEQKDIVISTQAVHHDFDLTPLGCAPGENSDFDIIHFPAAFDLVRLARQAAEGVVPDDVEIYEGTIASGDQFIAGQEQADRIVRLFSAMAVEMEGAAIAQVAYINQVPFVIIRGISDNADHNASLSFEEYVKVSSEVTANVVCKMMELA